MPKFLVTMYKKDHFCLLLMIFSTKKTEVVMYNKVIKDTCQILTRASSLFCIKQLLFYNLIRIIFTSRWTCTWCVLFMIHQQ